MMTVGVTAEEFGHILRSLASAWVRNNYHTFSCTKARIQSRARAMSPKKVSPQKYRRLVHGQTYRIRAGLPPLALNQYTIRYPG